MPRRFKDILISFVIMSVLTTGIIKFPYHANALGSTTPGGLTISPPLVEMNVSPGKSYVQTISLSNPTKEIMVFYPLAMNFRSEGESGQPSFFASTNGDEKFSLAKWISIGQPKIAIAPQQVVDFEYTIDVPQDAEPGGHYGVVFFSTQPPEISGRSSQVAVSSMIGSLILVKTDGLITERAELEEIRYKKLVFSGPVNFKSTISNLGNVHIKPIGEIDLNNSITNKRNSITFNPERGNILPASSRVFDNTWQPPKYAFGKYSANFKLVYGTNETLNQVVTFLVLPWWLFALFAVLVLIIIAIPQLRKHHKKKSFNKFLKVPK